MITRIYCFGLALTLILPAVGSAPVAAQKISLEKIEAVIAGGPYKAAWESMTDYQVPDWFQDAKFGIFIHWGPMSVTEFDDWYARRMYLRKSRSFRHHVLNYGPQDRVGYKDLIPKFTMEKFDPAYYAQLFRDAGAKFVVPVAEHHDGYPLYDCSFTKWDAVETGPKRDLIAELSKAVRKEGLVFGASSHRAENWWFYGGGREFDSDVQDPRYASLYGPAADREDSERQLTEPDQAFLNDWLLRTCELVDRYRPAQVWFDWWIGQPAFEPYLEKFAAYYYNRAKQWNQGVVIAYKYQAFPEWGAVLDLERGQLASIRKGIWQTDTSVSKSSWFYLRDRDYRTVDSLIDDLVDIVSKNGVLLLNIGPRSDGSIVEEEEKILREMGQWLSANGEAIYGTRPWKIFGEGPTQVKEGSFTDTQRDAFTSKDFRFTAKGETLYAIALKWPEGRKTTIKSLAEGSELSKQKIRAVSLIGSNAALEWTQGADGLVIDLPAGKPGDHAFVFKISPVDAVSQD